MYSGLNAMPSCRLRQCPWNSKNLHISQGDAELINECTQGPDIQKPNNGSPLMKTIVGIEAMSKLRIVCYSWLASFSWCRCGGGAALVTVAAARPLIVLHIDIVTPYTFVTRFFLEPATPIGFALRNPLITPGLYTGRYGTRY